MSRVSQKSVFLQGVGVWVGLVGFNENKTAGGNPEWNKHLYLYSEYITFRNISIILLIIFEPILLDTFVLGLLEIQED